MIVHLDPNSIDDYRKFLRIKSLPQYRIQGRQALFPDEYQQLVEDKKAKRSRLINWEPSPFLFDYQAAIARLAIRKQKYAVFAAPGMGKTLIMLEFANAAADQLTRRNKRTLIVCPLMVVRQTMAEAARWYEHTGRKLVQVRARDLASWISADDDGTIGITNYEAMTEEVPQGNLGALILDESSMLKSMYGKWGQEIIRLGRGLDWKLCLTGTPAPNDRIEYANHAVFLDHFPTVNSFLARFFVNRGQTDNRWELKPHALEAFYRALSHWCIFLTNPATYGWKDNCDTIPPIRVHIEDVPLTREQEDAVRKVTGRLIATTAGGITSRAKLAQLAKGKHGDEELPTVKYEYIRQLVEREPNRGTILWCRFNHEQEKLAATLPAAADITGATPVERREELIEEFKAGQRTQLISKPKILGFGLNLQIATRQIFSSLQDSYEEYYQAIKRSNRIGSTEPLDVYIPVTEIERPMIETVLRKAKMVDDDTAEQERIFRKFGIMEIA